MIEKELYSPNSFLRILEKNGIKTQFEGCNLYPDYVLYQFSLEEKQDLTEMQLYSVTFSVIVESEKGCYFIGKKDKQLVFLLTFTNDLKKFGLSKTKETSGVIPTENITFDYIKKPLERIVWYKFDTKKLTQMEKIKEFGLTATTAEERVLLDEFWKDITTK